MLNREETPQRVKDVETFLSDESRRKKDIKHDACDTNNKLGRPKEISTYNNKVEAGLDSEASNVSDNSDEEEENIFL